MLMNDEAALKVTFRRFLAIQPNLNRLFALHHLKYDGRLDENNALFSAYLARRRKGEYPPEPVFLQPQLLVEMEVINTAHSVKKALDVCVQFAIARGLTCDIVSRRKLPESETAIPTDSEDGYLLITFRFMPMEDIQADDGTDTITFRKSVTEGEEKHSELK